MNTIKNAINKHYVIIITFVLSSIFYYFNPAKLLPDDSLFYMVIAEYIVNIGESSFNGLIDTNGYHPLWMLFNVLAIGLGKLLDIEPLYFIGLIYHAFIALSIFYIYKLQTIWKSFSALTASLVIIFLFMSNGVLQNMESALALFFVVYSLYYFLVEKENITYGHYFKFGVVLGLLVLSRLDLVFFGIMLGMAFVFKNIKDIRLSPSKLLWFVAGGLLIVIPYLVYNQIAFGSIMPISGALKSSYPLVTFTWSRLFPYGLIVLVSSLIALVIAWYVDNKKVKAVLAILSFSTIIHAFYLALFQFPMTWYFITGYLLLSLVVAYFIKKIEASKLIYYTLISLLILFPVLAGFLRLTTDFTLRTHILSSHKINVQHNAQYRLMAENIASILPQHATVMTWDLPGVLAYFGRLKVFSADGLISNKQYQDELVELGAETLFERYKIEYIIVPISFEGTFYNGMRIEHSYINAKKMYKITIFSRLHNKNVGSLTLMDSDIIFKTHLFPDVNTSQMLGVFKIPKVDRVWHEK